VPRHQPQRCRGARRRAARSRDLGCGGVDSRCLVGNGPRQRAALATLCQVLGPLGDPTSRSCRNPLDRTQSLTVGRAGSVAAAAPLHLDRYTPTRALLSPPCLVLARLTDDSRERPTQCQRTHFQLPRPRELHHLVFCVGEKDASFQVLLACTYSDVLRRNLDLQPAAGSSHWPCHRQTILAVARRIGAVTPPAKEGHGGREGFGAAHPSRSTLVDRPLGREPSTPFPPRNRPSCRWFACPR
jgi:hypothetical protein